MVPAVACGATGVERKREALILAQRNAARNFARSVQPSAQRHVHCGRGVASAEVVGYRHVLSAIAVGYRINLVVASAANAEVSSGGQHGEPRHAVGVRSVGVERKAAAEA